MKGSHGLTLVVAQDLHARLDENRTEWVWRGSQSLGASAELFAGEIYGECASGRSTARPTNRDNNRTLVLTRPAVLAQEEAAAVMAHGSVSMATTTKCKMIPPDTTTMWTRWALVFTRSG